MTISKKGKRKITLDGRTYHWWGFHEMDQTSFDGDQIKLVAEDQSHYIQYGLQQEDSERFVVIGLSREQGLVSLKCPKFENEQGVITPSGIRKLVEWSKKKPGEATIRVITHAYAPKVPLPLSEEDRQKLYQHILDVVNKEN